MFAVILLIVEFSILFILLVVSDRRNDTLRLEYSDLLIENEDLKNKLLWISEILENYNNENEKQNDNISNS